MTKKILLSTLMLFLIAAINLKAQNGKIPARLQTEVIKLKYITFSKPIEETIKTIVDTDYSGKAFFTFDRKNNALIVTATNITIDKIKKFLNKFDVKGVPVYLKIYILTETKKGKDNSKLPAALMEKVKKIGVNNVKILSNAIIASKTGKSVFVSLKDPDYGTMFEISFLLSDEGEKIGLNSFKIYKLSKEKGNVYNKWQILESSYTISPKDPLIIGITGDNRVDYLFAVSISK